MPYRFNLKVRRFTKADDAGFIEAAVWIGLKSYAENHEGRILLTPECRGITELTECANRLKREIDSLVVTARKRFARERARRRKLLEAN